MPRKPEAIRITTATRSHREDIRLRERRYVISMTIRTACFLLAVVSIGHWFMWLFVAGSFLLPYVAVIYANAASTPDPGALDSFDPHPDTRAIEGGPDTSSTPER